MKRTSLLELEAEQVLKISSVLFNFYEKCFKLNKKYTYTIRDNSIVNSTVITRTHSFVHGSKKQIIKN